MRIRFGVRSFRTKTYPLEYFNISKEEAEGFCVPYDGFDIWNFKKEKVSETRIEKRFRYFHILFIPIVPLETEWTIRRTDGLLYRANEICEKKINLVYENKKSPWLKRILLFVLVFFLLLISYNLFFKKIIQSHKYEVNRINKLYNTKLEKLENLDEDDLILFVNKNDYFYLWNNSFREYGYVWKVEDEKVHIKYLTGRLADIRGHHTIYSIQKRFKNNQNSLVDTIFSKSDLIKRIPSKKSQIKNATFLLIHDIINTDLIDKPILTITESSHDSFNIGNKGKTVYLVDIVNENEQICEWQIKLPAKLKSKTSKSFDNFIVKAKVLNEEKFKNIKSKLIFTDNSNNLYEFELTKNKEKNEFSIKPVDNF